MICQNLDDLWLFERVNVTKVVPSSLTERQTDRKMTERQSVKPQMLLMYFTMTTCNSTEH